MMNVFYNGANASRDFGAQLAEDHESASSNRHALEARVLADRLERLQLACQAMWELIRDRTQLTEQDLENKILEIDVRDGKIDGQISTQALECHACGRPTNSKRATCVICGAPLNRQHKFES